MKYEEESKRCVVKFCENRSDHGNFVGDICAPCHAFIAEGRGVHNQIFRNAMEAARVMLDCASQVYAITDDRIVYLHTTNPHSTGG